jgi:hypothetical protein
MFIPYTKAQRIDRLSCMFVAGRDGYTLYMFPLMPRALGLACWPCSGPWQLKLSEY